MCYADPIPVSRQQNVHFLVFMSLVETPAGHAVVTRIIPAIANLRNKESLRFDTLFSPTQFKKLNLKSDELLCTDLLQSDLVFDTLRAKFASAVLHLPVDHL